MERSNPSDFVDGKGGDNGGKLDPLMEKQIHGSNPTKLHRKKIWGYFWWGIFGIRTKTTKSS